MVRQYVFLLQAEIQLPIRPLALCLLTNKCSQPVCFRIIHIFLWHFCSIPGPGLPFGASRSHSLDRQHSIGLNWKGVQPDAETSTWQQTTIAKGKHLCPNRDSNPQSQQASGYIPIPQTARPLRSAVNNSSLINFDDFKFDSTKIFSVILKRFSFI